MSQNYLINLASEEYFKVIDVAALNSNICIIHCVFKDSGKVVSTYAKRARGLMARYIIKCHAIDPKQDVWKMLKDFNYEDYLFYNIVSSSINQSTITYCRTSPTSNGNGKKRKLSNDIND